MPSTVSPALSAARIKSTASPGEAPNFDDSSTIAPVLGTFRRSARPACGACFLIFLDFLVIVVGDQRLVLVQFLQRLVGLDGIGVNDFVPDPVLPLLVRHVLDVFMDDAELRHRGHVEARAGFEQRLDDGRIGVGLDGVVGLDARQIFFERGVVAAQFVVVHHEQRRAVLFGQFFERSLEII